MRYVIQPLSEKHFFNARCLLYSMSLKVGLATSETNINILFAFMKAFKDDEKCFLFHLNGFIHFIHSQDI